MRINVRRQALLSPLLGLLPSLVLAQASGLTPVDPIVGTLAKGQKQQYSLVLESNQFIRISLERRDLDHIAVLDPAGKTIVERDAVFDPGFIQLVAIAPQSGSYRVELYGGAKDGRFTLRLLDQRPARESDAKSIEAQKAQNDGMKLLGKVHEAEPHLLTALRLAQEAGDTQASIEALGALCHVSRYLGKAKSQFDYATQLLETASKAANTYVPAHAHYHRGIAYADLGNLAAAVEELEKAVELSVRNNDPNGQGSSLNILGGLFSRAGQHKRAIEYYQRALPIFRDLGSKRFIAAALLSIGSDKNDLDLPVEAEAPLNEALDLYRQLKDRRNEAVVLRLLGNSASAREQYDPARKLFEQSAALFREQKSGQGLASALTALGSLYANQKQWEPAMAPLEEALALYRRNPQVSVNPGTLNWLARVETERGNLDRAELLAEEMIASLEGRRAQTGGSGARDQYFAEYRPAYGALIEIQNRRAKNDPTAVAKAFAWSERSRARGFQELLAQSKIDLTAGVEPKTLRELASLEKEIQSNLRTATAGTLVELRDKQERIQMKIREANPRYAAALAPQPGLKQIQQELLDPETVLIEYFVAQRKSYVWAVTRDSIEMAELPGRVVLEPLLRAAYDAVSARNQQVKAETAEARAKRIAEAEVRWAEHSKQLRDLLLQPVSKHLDRKRWLIAGDDWLHYLPFAALAPEKEVVQLPSISAFASIRSLSKDRKPAPKLVAVFADPVYSSSDSRVKPSAKPVASELARLPFTRREASGILAGLPPAKVKLAADFEASRETLAATNFAEFQIAHFATHGVLNEETPELSGIVLSLVDANGKPRDGALRLHDLYQMKLPVDLAVLSGCQTALGKNMRGEGIVGLTRGMMYAGASRVVSTLWKVDDAASAELMRLFYDGMFARKLHAAAALQQAQAALRAQRRWRDPYFWAGFQLSGDYR